MTKNKNLRYFILTIVFAVCILQGGYADANSGINVNANGNTVGEQYLNWTSGDTYTVTPGSMVTERNYTIKAIDFPPPVRGGLTVNDTIAPLNPVTPFVTFELYYDMVSNSSPVAKFTLSNTNDYYITQNQELKISLTDIPDSTSQDWVYEYYAPQATILVQQRAVPNLDIVINLVDSNGNVIYGEDSNGNVVNNGNITPSTIYGLQISLTNTGGDVLENANYNVDIGSMTLISTGENSSLKGSIDQLAPSGVDNLYMNVEAPVSLEQGENQITVNVTGYDIKGFYYAFNSSMIFGVTSALESIYATKLISKNTTYLQETQHVMLNIYGGYTGIRDVRVQDTIPENLQFANNNAQDRGVERVGNMILMNRSSIGSGETWLIEYNLKPMQPGVYMLPPFKVNFSLGGRQYSTASGGSGFTVYGPVVVLNKSVMSAGGSIVNVSVSATNIGNGWTKITVQDQLPENSAIASGSLNWSTDLDVGVEKSNDYTVQLNGANLNVFNASIWSPAKATYYLDDYVFHTASNETVNMTIMLPIDTPVVQPATTPVATIQSIGLGTISAEEQQRKVVATIPPVPVETPSKTTPGFTIDTLVIGMVAVLILIKKAGNKS
jgi:hypothetical protein